MSDENKKTVGESRTVEESFALLDQMVKDLESEDITLEDSFRLYQEGMKLLKEVNGTIDTYEKKIQLLSENGETGDLDKA
jgi:exodeoxyribonuclease VII small subunit